MYQTLIDAIDQTLDEIQEANRINYDHIENKVIEGINDAFTRLKRNLANVER